MESCRFAIFISDWRITERRYEKSMDIYAATAEAEK